MFVCSLFLFPGVMAPWITEWSMSTMELKVLLDSNYYYLAFIVIFVCFLRRCSRLVLTCGGWNKDEVRLVAEISCLFSGAVGSSCPLALEGATWGASQNKHAYPCGSISDTGRVRLGGGPKTCWMDYMSQQVWERLWSTQEHPGGAWGYSLGAGSVACCFSDLDKKMDGCFYQLLVQQTRINGAHWITCWITIKTFNPDIL